MTQTLRPINQVAGGPVTGGVSWTNFGGSDYITSVTDGVDGTYVHDAAGGNKENNGQLTTTASDPGVDTGHTLFVRAEDVAAGTGLPQLGLYQGDPMAGGTLILLWAFGRPTPLTTVSQTLADVEAAAITNYADLWWGLSRGGGTMQMHVAEIWFEIPDPPAPPFVLPSEPSHRQYEPPDNVPSLGRGPRRRGRR